MKPPFNFKDEVSWGRSISARYISKAKNAADRGIAFEMTLQEFLQMFKRRKCYLTGVELKFGTEFKDDPAYSTIDRIDNKKGYTFQNSKLVTSVANQGKSVFENGDLLNLIDLVRMAKVVEKHLKENK